MSDVSNTVVVDYGTSTVKAGFAKSKTPQCIFPSIFGKSTENENRYLFSQESLRNSALFELRQPIQHGIVVDWKEMETLMKQTMENELRTDSSEVSLLWTEKVLKPKSNREKATQMLFETFGIESLCFANEAKLSLFASGRTTGLSLTSGYSVSQTVPIVDGHIATPHGILTALIGGRTVTKQLWSLLGSPKYGTTLLDDIKRSVCFVAQDFDAELRNIQLQNETKSYLLPDGQTLKVGGAQCQATEQLFTGNQETENLAVLVVNAVSKCDIHVRTTLLKNIVLSGGNTCIQGFEHRLQSDVNKDVAKKIKCKVIAPKNRNFSVWTGGALLSQITGFRKQWMTKAEYYDCGSSYIHRKAPF